MTPREKELTRQLEQCQQALTESRRENALLRQKIDLLVKRVFGSSSEQLDTNQLELLMPLRQQAPPCRRHRGRAGEGTRPEFPQGRRAAFAGEPAGGGGSD